jgi:hypothetical protein
VIDPSDHELRLQNPNDIQNPTIRPVPPSDSETSPYSTEDTGYHQRRGHVHAQSQVPPELQHQQYGQAGFEQQQQQYHQFANQQQQAQYQGGNQHAYSGHLGNPQQQNPETVSQLSHESPATDSDQRSATNIPPAQTGYQAQTQDLSGRQNPPGGQAPTPQQQQQQNMAPPPGGPAPGRRSQDAEKMRDQAQPPPGPPPNYRQSQQPPNMNPLPQPPNAGPQNPSFRASNVPDRQQQFDGQGDMQGRNSPQPPPSDRPAEDPDKAFKDLCMIFRCTNASRRPAVPPLLTAVPCSDQVQERQKAVLRR